MKKIAASVLCLTLICFGSVTAFAAAPSQYTDQAVISTSVPEEHMLTFRVTGNVEFKLNGEKGNEFRVPRQSEPLLELIPNEGEKLVSVVINGEDVTSKLDSGKYQFPPIYEDKEVIVSVTTEKEPQPDPQPDDPNPKTGLVGGISVSALALLAGFAFASGKRSGKQK